MPPALAWRVEALPFQIAGHRFVDLPVPTAAVESRLDLAELKRIAGLLDMVDIKLDMCGGSTEGLMIAKRARELGLKVMVGNRGGSSLAMAPPSCWASCAMSSTSTGRRSWRGTASGR